MRVTGIRKRSKEKKTKRERKKYYVKCLFNNRNHKYSNILKKTYLFACFKSEIFSLFLFCLFPNSLEPKQHLNAWHTLCCDCNLANSMQCMLNSDPFQSTRLP